MVGGCARYADISPHRAWAVRHPLLFKLWRIKASLSTKCCPILTFSPALRKRREMSRSRARFRRRIQQSVHGQIVLKSLQKRIQERSRKRSLSHPAHRPPLGFLYVLWLRVSKPCRQGVLEGHNSGFRIIRAHFCFLWGALFIFSLE